MTMEILERAYHIFAVVPAKIQFVAATNPWAAGGTLLALVGVVAWMKIHNRRGR